MREHLTCSPESPSGLSRRVAGVLSVPPGGQRTSFFPFLRTSSTPKDSMKRFPYHPSVTHQAAGLCFARPPLPIPEIHPILPEGRGAKQAGSLCWRREHAQMWMLHRGLEQLAAIRGSSSEQDTLCFLTPLLPPKLPKAERMLWSHTDRGQRMDERLCFARHHMCHRRCDSGHKFNPPVGR